MKWPVSPPTQRQLWRLFMLTLTFTLLHLMNFLTSCPSHSLLRCFRCVSGGLKMAFAAVSKGARASQQTPPVLSPTCVLNSWTHSCRGSPSSPFINLARIKSQACSKVLWPKARGPPWRTHQFYVCLTLPWPYSFQLSKNKKTKSIHHSFDRGLLSVRGSHYLLLTNKLPRNKMALHNYLLLLLMKLSFGCA